MNLDQQQSTEEDWVQQSQNENEYFDISSSPIQFGRQTHKIKYKNVINSQDFDSQIQQIEQSQENEELNHILINSFFPKRQYKIKKYKKIKNNTIKYIQQEILQSILENTKSKQQVLQLLQQCQNMKVIIDGLERSLMKIKHVLLLTAKINEC